MYSGIQIEPANTSNWRVADESWSTVGSKPGLRKYFLDKEIWWKIRSWKILIDYIIFK